MKIWLFLVSVVLKSADTKDNQFECGEHGRFEYCIDGFPGCIIGCHCHPGFYFDTDTKICEPNSKLLQNYRRQYVAEPTRIPLTQMDSPEVLEQSTSSPTRNPLDDHVDNIAQNADDLGDWLYNQFFKAIESQVINKTKENVITRRSGKGHEGKISKKKKRKKEKKGSKKRTQKEDDLRRKLLRITEDDSLFDSDTDTDSSDTSSSGERDESKDQEHGHKKFVIVNKKPKPPLPSFIFLPNIETPFYPPVGLPPPVLPMYPMVPVPPVLPAYPFQNMPPECTEGETTPATISTSSSTTISKTTTTSDVTTTTETNALKYRPDKKTSNVESTTKVNSVIVMNTKKNKDKRMRNEGDNALRRLRELVQHSALKRKRKKTQTVPVEDIDRTSIEIDKTIQVQPINDLILPTNDNSPLMDEDGASDFKYISQLIHRINLNNTEKVQKSIKPNNKNHKPFINYQKGSRFPKTHPKIIEPSRRFIIPREVSTQESKLSDNSFYENLGKQIATLIRGVEAKNDRQIDIEIEHMDQNTPSQPIFSELSYAPHSFWERFARSPMNYLEQYRKKKEYVRRSNEILYNIENKVELAASTMLPMSLLEIENFIKAMDGSQDELQESNLKKYQSNNTLDINLWPQDPPTINPAIPIVKKHQQHYNTNKYTSNNNQSNSKAVRMRNMFSAWTGPEHTVNNISSYKINNTKLDNTSDDRNNKIIITNIDIPITKKIPNNAITLIRQHKLTPTRRTSIPRHYQSLSAFDYNKKQYVDQYPFYNNLLQFKFPTVEKSANKPLLRTEGPSYFHREVHHFEYID